MAQAQFIYGHDGSMEGRHKETPLLTDFMKQRSRPETPEQAFANLEKWFLTDLETDDKACSSFVYCPVGLKTDNIPTIAAYGMNGWHSYDRPTRYLQMYLSDLDDIKGKAFFGMFAMPYLRNREVEELFTSGRSIGTFRLERTDFHDISRKAISDEALKAILLRLYRKEKIYILSDVEDKFSRRAMEVFEYIYSFLPSEVRRTIGCISYKPYKFTRTRDIHINISLIFLSQESRSSIVEQYIDLGAQNQSFTAQNEQEKAFLDSLEKWIPLPFEQREGLIESLQGYLIKNNASMSALSSYVGLFEMADPLKHWWQSADKKYSVDELKQRYLGDYMVQNHAGFKQEFIRNIPNLIEGDSLDVRMNEAFDRAQSIQDLLNLDEGLLFFADNFQYPSVDAKRVKAASARIFGKTHGMAEWKYMKAILAAGKPEKPDARSSPTISALLDIYRNVDKRYDDGWDKSSMDNLYAYWAGISDHTALLDQVTDAYGLDPQTVSNWKELNSHISEADLNAYVEGLPQSRNAQEAWDRLILTLDFAYGPYDIAPESITATAQVLMEQSLLDTDASVDALLKPLGKKGDSKTHRLLYDYCMQAVESRQKEGREKELMLGEKEKLLDQKLLETEQLSNTVATLAEENKQLKTEKTEAELALQQKDSEIDHIQRQQETLNTEKAKTEERAEKFRAGLEDAKQELKQTRDELDGAKKALDGQKRELEEAKKEIDTYKKELDRKDAELEVKTKQWEQAKTTISSIKAWCDHNSISDEVAKMGREIRSGFSAEIKELEKDIKSISEKIADLKRTGGGGSGSPSSIPSLHRSKETASKPKWWITAIGVLAILLLLYSAVLSTMSFLPGSQGKKAQEVVMTSTEPTIASPTPPPTPSPSPSPAQSPSPEPSQSIDPSASQQP